MTGASRTPVTHLLYLHGFRSSPQSTKARIVGAWLAARRPDIVWHCPQLSASPAAAMRELLAATADWPRATTGIVGSSLGGYYATVLAEALGAPVRAVLLNPAIEPARDLVPHVGEVMAWHSAERFEFRAGFIDELRAMRPPAISAPGRYLAVIAKGDEVLGWREMRARYAGCRVELLEGSDHALSDFERDQFGLLLRFLGLA